MSTSGQFMGFALGALTASLAILVFAGPPTQKPICSNQSAQSGRETAVQIGSACVDARPIERLLPMAGDVTVGPTADGRGIQIALQEAGTGMVPSSAAGSSIDHMMTRRQGESESDRVSRVQSDHRLNDDRAREADTGIGDRGSFADIIPPVRANRRELPVFRDDAAPDPVSTSPGQAWDTVSRPTGEYREASGPEAGDREREGVNGSTLNAGRAPMAEPSATPAPSTRRSSLTDPEVDADTPGVPSLLADEEVSGTRSAGVFAESARPQIEPERMESAGNRFAFNRRGGIDRREVATLPELASDGRAASAEEPDDAPETTVEPETILDDVGDVRLRAGEHDSFSRLVFDWPREIEYSVDSGSGQARILFPVTARVDADAARRQTLSRIRGFDIEQTDEGIVLTIDMAASMGVRAFRLENRVVIDVQPS